MDPLCGKQLPQQAWAVCSQDGRLARVAPASIWGRGPAPTWGGCPHALCQQGVYNHLPSGSLHSGYYQAEGTSMTGPRENPWALSPWHNISHVFSQLIPGAIGTSWVTPMGHGSWRLCLSSSEITSRTCPSANPALPPLTIMNRSQLYPESYDPPAGHWAGVQGWSWGPNISKRTENPQGTFMSLPQVFICKLLIQYFLVCLSSPPSYFS